MSNGLVRGWRRVDRVAEARDERRRHDTRELRTWVDADGMVVIHGRLSPEVGAVVHRALEAASERLYKETAGTDPCAEETTAGQRRADALGLVAEAALAADLDRGTAGDRYQVVVHVDDGVLESDDATGQSALEDGPYVSAETSRRLACDAATVAMRYARNGTVLDVGRRTRTVPPALRRALTARDRRCRFPRLQRPPLRRPPRPALGPGGHHKARQSGASLSSPPPRGARGGLRGDTVRRRRGPLRPAGRSSTPVRATGAGLDGLPAGAIDVTARGSRCRHRREHGDALLAW